MSRPSEAWRDGEWAGDGLDNAADDGTGPYRVLLAQVLWRAAEDLKLGTREDATDAYRWICGLDGHSKWLMFVCDHLHLRVAWVRDQLVPPVRDKCERWLREDAQERIRARSEREQKDEATKRLSDEKKAKAAVLLAARMVKSRTAWRRKTYRQKHD